MDKQIVVHLDNAILLSNKKDDLMIHKTVWIRLKIIMLSKEFRQKRVHSVFLHSYETLENANHVQKVPQWLPEGR